MTWPQQPYKLPSSLKCFIPGQSLLLEFLWPAVPFPVCLPSISQQWDGTPQNGRWYSACSGWLWMWCMFWSLLIFRLPSILKTTIFSSTDLNFSVALLASFFSGLSLSIHRVQFFVLSSSFSTLHLSAVIETHSVSNKSFADGYTAPSFLPS